MRHELITYECDCWNCHSKDIEHICISYERYLDGAGDPDTKEIEFDACQKCMKKIIQMAYNCDHSFTFDELKAILRNYK